jgi:hypothetical protein
MLEAVVSDLILLDIFFKQVLRNNFLKKIMGLLNEMSWPPGYEEFR